MSDHAKGVVIALGGVFALSFDAVLIRLAGAPIADIIFWRGWLIALAMLMAWLPLGQRPAAWSSSLILGGFAAAGLYAVAASLFVASVSLTRAANTVVILASSPFFAALWSWLFLGERLRLRTAVAIAVAMAGVVMVFGGGMAAGSLMGDGLALTLAMLVAGALTVLRTYPGVDRLLVTAASGAIAGLLVVPWTAPLSLPVASYGWLAIMGLVQMPLAMLGTMTATRYLSAPEVSLFLLLETVLAPIWVWLAVGEAVPPLTFYGGAVVLMTVAWHASLGLRGPAR